MLRPAVRLVVVLLTLAVTAGVVWKATANERARGQVRFASEQLDSKAAAALFVLSEFRATLHAYVAPGQGQEFWSTRGKSQLDALRARLTELDSASVAADYPLAPAFEALEKLASLERRAHGYVRAEQRLAAGDVIFSDAGKLIDELTTEIAGARQAFGRARSAQEGRMANEQSLLAGALMAVWIFALILLFPVPTAVAARPQPAAPVVDLLKSQSEAVSLPLREPVPVPVPAPVPPVAPPPTEAELDETETTPDPISLPPAETVVPSVTPLFQDLAALCFDLGRVSDVEELPPLLARVADLIEARGVVVWLLADERQELVPAVAHGYDAQVLSILGPLMLTADNLTADAFRTASAVTTAATPDHEAAVAVPIVSATGPSGVLTAEVQGGGDLNRAAAIASVVAAQLANLFPAPTVAEGPPEAVHV